ncbi:hypothetical protein ACSVDE_18835 [Pseudalkalibacillus sp. Hm43]|uniref:hypothetical protein n=1 Tax=Pseudalkalibacillus sp. Hm43 TaxID=3450742 RepID=UPI003F43F414
MMDSKATWQKRMIILFVTLFALLIPVASVSANIGNYEYEDNGLTSTDGDGSGENENNDPGGLVGWFVKAKDITGDFVDKTRDFFDPAIEAGKDTWEWTKGKFSDGWEWTKDKASDGWDWTKNKWGDFTEWTGDVWEATPDWVKSSLAFVGVGAAAVGIAAAGIISAPVAAVAIVGAGLAGGLYYALNGGSDAYSFTGALGWTAGGAILGGVGQAIGAVGAGLNALRIAGGRQLASMRLGYILNRFATGGSGLRAGLQVAKGLGAAWLKVGSPLAIITFLSHITNFALTGELDRGEMFFDVGVTFLTAPLGFGLTKSLLSSVRTFKVFATHLFGGAVIGGFSNVAMQAYKGDATAMDFLIGSAVGLSFVIPDTYVNKVVNNSSVEYSYEYLKKQLSDVWSNHMDQKVDSKGNK